jgi:hypothetical protein
MSSCQRWRTICVIVQTPQQEDRMHNHKNPVVRQRRLRFEDEEVWTMLPEEVRERCRSLWKEMLASVLKERERMPDERED